MSERIRTSAPDGWGKHRCDEEDKQGRRVQMPEWVMADACRNVDACTAAAIVEVAPDVWAACNAYDAEPLWDCEPCDITEARMDADRHNRERDVMPLVVPASFAIIGARNGRTK